MPRLFTPHPLHEGASLTLDDGQAHYLGAVMRRAAGDDILLFNGTDGEFRARLTRLAKQRGEAEVMDRTRPQAPEPDLWLAFAPLKRDLTGLVVQKATELGVSVLLPVFTARTNAARINEGRLAAIAREAAEQSERLSVPEIRPAGDLGALLDGWPEERRLAAAIERAGAAPSPRAAGALLVGPEGGFAPAELDALRACRFVSPLALGPRILRAETAVIAGLAILQAESWSSK